MKKLMIAFAALLCAVAANAATVNWQSGTIKVAGAEDGTAGSLSANTGTRLVTAYLYTLTAADYAAASAMSTTELYTKYIEGGITASASKGTGATGAANISQTVADAAGNVYGLVLYVDTKTAASYDNVDVFVKSALATVDVGGSSTYGATALATQQANWTAIGGSVPEPTSGLLLLIGMAGLALRRKQA